MSDSCYRLFRHFFGTENDQSPLVILVRENVCRNKKWGSPGYYMKKSRVSFITRGVTTMRVPPGGAGGWPLSALLGARRPMSTLGRGVKGSHNACYCQNQKLRLFFSSYFTTKVYAHGKKTSRLPTVTIHHRK